MLVPLILGLVIFALRASSARAQTVLVEAESFSEPGGWSLDTQFIEIMGSPYLLAHGLGAPVKDATTTVKFPASGKYRVLVRTKDWVAPWKAPGQPGKFQLLIEGQPLKETFGTKGADWAWQDGGTVEITKAETKISLHDLTGFDGRCDAIVFTQDATFTLPNDTEPFPAWRRKVLGLGEKMKDAGPFDLVVIGGGYSGMGAALSAARMGCKVALIQNRPVLGGNGSSEVRVWAMGGTRRGLYPQLGEIVEEFMDKAKASPGTFEEFGDTKKEALVRAEKNLTLHLNTHAFSVELSADKKSIVAVVAFNTETGEVTRFAGKLFCDATGHGTIGALAGAAHTTKEEGHLGMSNMWRWEDTDQPQKFPDLPWALSMTMDDFPYPKRGLGEWFWESGFNKHPLRDLESMRDWNLRAVFGAFNTMKNKDGAKEHPKAKLVWVAYIGGTRESRQLLGDVVLTREDIEQKKPFPDGCVPTTWDIDLHYPKEQYAKNFTNDPFISKAVFDKAVDRQHGYPVPYRTFYSTNIGNLFMAGRCISVTHEALGTVRVMKTGGMIGEVVGKAASLCIRHEASPRDIYDRYFTELQTLMRLPGAARRDTVQDEPKLPANYQPLTPPATAGETFTAGLNVKTLGGLVLDDAQAKLTGKWTTGGNPELQPYVAGGYRYRGAGDTGAARYEFKIEKAGDYEVRVSYSPHPNRATNTRIVIESVGGTKETTVNQRTKPPLAQNFISLGTFRFEPGRPAVITIGGKAADGNVHADAVQLLPQF